MATKKKGKAGSKLEALAGKLEALQREAADAGEERMAKSIGNAVKSCRWEQTRRRGRLVSRSAGISDVAFSCCVFQPRSGFVG